jgi:hypothetical protein
MAAFTQPVVEQPRNPENLKTMSKNPLPVGIRATTPRRTTILIVHRDRDRPGRGQPGGIDKSRHFTKLRQRMETAVRLIAGMIQCTRTIGPVWDRLSPEEIASLMTHWQQAIDEKENPEQAARNIIHSIANHAQLRPAWNDLGDSIHQSRALIIRIIVAKREVA